MKLLIPTIMIVTSCVTYPRHVTKYDCTEIQKSNLPEVVNNCIGNFRDTKKAKEVSDACYEVALKSLCSPADYFERVNMFGDSGSAIPCKFSLTFYENYICDGY